MEDGARLLTFPLRTDPEMFRALLILILLASGCFALEVEKLDRVIVMRDDTTSVAVSTFDGTIRSLKWKGTELVREGKGYWSLAGGSSTGRAAGFPRPASISITADPSENDGTMARVSVKCPNAGDPGLLPVNATFHYALRKDGPGLYIYAEFEHPEDFPSFGVGEARFAVKVSPDVFDYIHIDSRRSGPVPSGEDWDRGTELNMKEIRRIETGPFKGRIEHKYDYSALFSESPAYGWYSTEKKIGLWMANPSLEYIAGGPTKPELTAHLDVNPGGRPVLLNMWQGSHYGGGSLSVQEGESWSKIIGPFLLIINDGKEAPELADDALKATAAEAKAWPYAWVDSPLYAAKERKDVRGTIALADPPEDAGTMWVGLTAPDYVIERERWSSSVDWQRDGKHYQYWAKAEKDGSFELRGVRPGTYVLRAFRDGVFGEFEKSDVKIAEDTDLGTLSWTAKSAGPTLWEIGIPNRSAVEFRGGDDYWKWGNYLRYKKAFPDGVDYTVGKSDWKKDWFICQPPVLGENDRVTGNSNWKIHFDLEDGDIDTVLRIALCGFRDRGSLRVMINGRYAGDTGRFSENGVMHRDGIRGRLQTWSFPLRAEWLNEGTNTIELRSIATVWHQGILYDYLRLERVEKKLTQSEKE